MTKSAVDVIVTVAKASNSNEEAIAALRKLAAGEDGIAGTSDDVVPASVVEVLAYLLDHGVASDIVALANGGEATGILGKALATLKKIRDCFWRGGAAA